MRELRRRWLGRRRRLWRRGRRRWRRCRRLRGSRGRPSSAGNPTCAYVDGTCGEGEGKRCTETGASCGESPNATFCACDGSTFAAPKGCVIGSDERPGACPPPVDRFFCGALDCALGTEFCDLRDGTTSCAAVPAECDGAADLCLCLGYDGTGNCECTALADGHVEVGCYL